MAIYVTDIAMRGNRYDGVELLDQERGGPFWYRGGWNVAGTTAAVVGGIASSLFLTTDAWAGPIAQAMGSIDLSVPVGVLVSAALYLGLSRSAVNRGPRV